MHCIINNTDRIHRTFISALVFLSIVNNAVSTVTEVGGDTIQVSDGVPELGRGYSVITNSFQSSCINVDNIEVKESYNFDYYFTDFSSSEMKDIKKNLAGKVMSSFGYGRVKEIVSDESPLEEDIIVEDGEMPPLKRYTSVVTMRLESLSSTMTDRSSAISQNALKMLRDEEYVNFFMACGPTYVRTIHRAQEVTSIIRYRANDDFTAELIADALKLHILGNRGDSMKDRSTAQMLPMNFTGFNLNVDFDEAQFRDTLSIEVIGYGLGLNEPESGSEGDASDIPLETSVDEDSKPNGPDVIVAASLDEFNEIMRTAFDTMTTSEDSTKKGNGMVYLMEVESWADNAEFLKVSNIDHSTILVPVPRSVMEQAVGVTNQNGIVVSYECSSPMSQPDDYGMCCDPFDLVEVATTDELGHTITRSSCAPRHYVSTEIMKDNLATNAEFVSWLTHTARKKLESLTKLTACVRQLRFIPGQYEYNFIKPSKETTYEQAFDEAYTVKELLATFDPLGNMGIVDHVGMEHDEYHEMFYQPCLSALYGKNMGLDETTDPKFIMSDPWYNFEACAMPSCLEKDMAWDRKNGGGCALGIMGRKVNGLPIPAVDDSHCAKVVEEGTDNQECKYNMDSDLVSMVDGCRESAVKGIDVRGREVSFSLSNLVDYFCMPIYNSRLTADADKKVEADSRQLTCSTSSL